MEKSETPTILARANTIPFEAIAESAYRAYAASNRKGNCQEWGDLTRAEQIAWEAAVRQAERCLEMGQKGIEEIPAGNEDSWQEWIPPEEKTRMKEEAQRCSNKSKQEPNGRPTL